MHGLLVQHVACRVTKLHVPDCMCQTACARLSVVD
jgi:hypothetical protein